MSQEQFNCGELQQESPVYKNDNVWHSNHRSKNDPNFAYWCGNWYYRTPLQLLRECQTTIRDLLINHPELADHLQ